MVRALVLDNERQMSVPVDQFMSNFVTENETLTADSRHFVNTRSATGTLKLSGYFWLNIPWQVIMSSGKGYTVYNLKTTQATVHSSVD